MRSSLFAFGLLLLAAGSSAKPFDINGKAKRGSCPKNKKSDISQGASIPAGANPTVPVQSASPLQSTPPTQSTLPDGGIQPIGNGSTIPGGGGGGGGGGSAGGFCNVVFNGGASTQSGWPAKTWGSLSSAGVDDWVGFTLVNPEKTTPELNAHQIHLVMDPRNVNDAVELIKTNPPQYLGLLNEPDYSFEGGTPLTDPATAAKALEPILTAPHPQTTFLSPAVAYSNSDWLTSFRDACNNCFEQIPIISMHIYTVDTNDVLNKVTTAHATWPDKKIWLTELGPATQGCTFDSSGIIQWMNTVLPQLKQLGYVEKVFWNCGEHGAGIDGTPNGPCNPSLTNEDGSPTDLLAAYSKLCVGGGTVPTS